MGLGCNNFGMRLDGDATARVVDAAIDFFDTAESYGNGASEELLGRALSGRRDDVVIATKWGHTRSLGESERGGDPRLIRERLDVSLARLGTDYVDHYQLHRPDPLTPMDETLGCLTDLRAAGKIRECGATHFTADGLRGAHAAATTHDLGPFPSVQNHYSLLTRALGDLPPEEMRSLLALRHKVPGHPLAEEIPRNACRNSATSPKGKS